MSLSCCNHLRFAVRSYNVAILPASLLIPPDKQYPILRIIQVRKAHFLIGLGREYCNLAGLPPLFNTPTQERKCLVSGPDVQRIKRIVAKAEGPKHTHFCIRMVLFIILVWEKVW